MGFEYPCGNTEFEFQRMKVFSGLQPEKGVDYSSVQNCMWGCHFVSIRKIPTSLLNKYKTMILVHPMSLLQN